MAKASETAAVEPIGRRSLVMGWFNSDRDKLELQTAYIEAKEKNAKCEPRPLGQVAGRIYEVVERMGKLPNGEMKPSLLAIGAFEAINYKTGEVIESSNAYLPQYFLESAAAILKREPDLPGIDFGIEILIEATGKEVPFAYTVKNIDQRPADSPLDAIKRRMQKKGTLRLSPPSPIDRQLAAPEEAPAADA